MPHLRAGFAGLILVVLAAASGKAQAPLLKLDIPYQAVGIGVTPLWTAIEGGLFRPYGIEATTEFVSQSPVLVASMLSGETPFAIAGEDAVISADMRGGDIAILASGPEKLVFTIYAAPTLHDVADLKGKKIGISRFGATTDFIARYILKHAGLRPDQDATIFPDRDAGQQSRRSASRRDRRDRAGAAHHAQGESSSASMRLGAWGITICCSTPAGSSPRNPRWRPIATIR